MIVTPSEERCAVRVHDRRRSLLVMGLRKLTFGQEVPSEHKESLAAAKQP